MRLYAKQPIGTVPRARQLRRGAPEPERRLLRAVRETFPALKWRHQAPVGRYFVDILCFSEALAIEVDGETHMGAERYDASRTRFIESEGYRVQRFWNNEVMENLGGVIEAIANSLSHRERGGAAKRRKGEGSTSARAVKASDLPSPLPPPSAAGPSPLPKGEGL